MGQRILHLCGQLIRHKIALLRHSGDASEEPSMSVEQQLSEHHVLNNVTLPERSEVVKTFTPECGGKTPRGHSPQGFFPDTRGGKIFATERERVMALLI